MHVRCGVSHCLLQQGSEGTSKHGKHICLNLSVPGLPESVFRASQMPPLRICPEANRSRSKEHTVATRAFHSERGRRLLRADAGSYPMKGDPS